MIHRHPNKQDKKQGIVTVNSEYECHSKTGYGVIRRMQDVFISFLALIVLSPLMLIIAILIYIDDPGCIPLFAQIRCGKNGKPFKLYKFRSMCENAEVGLAELLEYNEMDGMAFKMKNDPRITRIGHILRQTGLDELPQLWNILKGDMSIVGPRPALPREVEQYTDYYWQRMYVIPGLTCYWQIQPKRNRIPFQEWVELDIKYIQEQSLWVDWKIIFLTLRTVFDREGL